MITRGVQFPLDLFAVVLICTAGQVANNVLRAVGMYEVVAHVIPAPSRCSYGRFLCNSPQLDGVSGCGNGRGDVPK